MTLNFSSHHHENFYRKIRSFSLCIVLVLILIILANLFYNLYARRQEEERLIQHEARALVGLHMVMEIVTINERTPIERRGPSYTHLDEMDTMAVINESLSRFNATTNHRLKITGLNARKEKNRPNAFEKQVLIKMKSDPAMDHFFQLDEKTSNYYYIQRLEILPSCLSCHGKSKELSSHIERQETELELGEFIGAFSLRIPSMSASGIMAESNFILVLFTLIISILSFLMVLFFLRKISLLSLSLSSTNDALEKQNRKLRQLEIFKEDFFHMLIHDMKAPLTFMSGSLQLLLEKNAGPLNEEQEDLIALVLRGCDRLEEMIINILDINRLEDGKLELNPRKIDLRDFLARRGKDWEKFAIRQKKTFSIEYHVQRDIIECDLHLLERILENLISNAFKHTESQKGAITLSLENSSNFEIIFKIADNGEGIPEKFMDKLFEKYSLIGHPNNALTMDTGLGLTFCKLASEAMGGKIWAESASGKGTVFYLMIPEIIHL